MKLTYVIEEFSKDKAASFANEMIPLGALHWKEEGNNTEFVPDVAYYGMSWEHSYLKIVTARNESNELVGYALTRVTPNSHDRQLTGVFFAIFLKKEYRGKSNGKGLFDFALEDMKRQGAKKVIASAMPNTGYETWLRISGFKIKSVELVHEY